MHSYTSFKNHLSKKQGINQKHEACPNSLEIPLSVIRGLEFIAPDLANKLQVYQQESNKLNVCYIEIYNQLLSLIDVKFSTLIDKQKADLQKELISIDGRKNFIKNYQNHEDYYLLIDDAITHSSPEYEEKIKEKLHRLDEFMTSITLKQCK